MPEVLPLFAVKEDDPGCIGFECGGFIVRSEEPATWKETFDGIVGSVNGATEADEKFCTVRQEADEIAAAFFRVPAVFEVRPSLC